MDFKTFQTARKADLPELLQVGDSFSAINSLEVKTIQYNGKATEVGTVQTDKGVRGTFSGVIIKTLQEYFKENKEPLTNVRVVQPRGKQYLQLESL